jgi:hypothetical protein
MSVAIPSRGDDHGKVQAVFGDETSAVLVSLVVHFA